MSKGDYSIASALYTHCTDLPIEEHREYSSALRHIRIPSRPGYNIQSNTEHACDPHQPEYKDRFPSKSTSQPMYHHGYFQSTNTPAYQIKDPGNVKQIYVPAYNTEDQGYFPPNNAPAYNTNDPGNIKQMYAPAFYTDDQGHFLQNNISADQQECDSECQDEFYPDRIPNVAVYEPYTKLNSAQQDPSEPSITYENTDSTLQLSDPKVWGPAMWFSLHNGAIHYPVNATPIVSTGMEAFIFGLPFMLPCEECSNHCRDYLEVNGDMIEEACSGRKPLFTFFWNLHNFVNERLHKATMSFDDAWERYSKGIRLYEIKYH